MKIEYSNSIIGIGFEKPVYFTKGHVERRKFAYLMGIEMGKQVSFRNVHFAWFKPMPRPILGCQIRICGSRVRRRGFYPVTYCKE